MPFLNEPHSFAMPGTALALGGCFAAAIVYILGSLVYNVYFHPLSAYPGPKIYAASQIPSMLMVLGGESPQRLLEMHTKYGHVVRIGPNELSYNHGDAWKDIAGIRAGKPEMLKEPLFYGKADFPAPGIFTEDTAPHRQQRRLLSHPFSEKALRDQEPIVKGYIDLLIQRLHEADKVLENMVQWYNWTTFDLIGDLAFGESFGCLQNCVYHPWISMIFQSPKALVSVALTRRIPGLSGLLKYFIPKKQLEDRNTHIALTKAKLQKRIEFGAERPDFLNNILRLPKEKAMTDAELLQNASTLIIAGSETTATLLSGATFYLLRNPPTLEKLVKEIRDKFATEDEITMVSVNSCAYLLAVLNEALRIYPPVPVGMPRVVPSGGDEIVGKWVPGGTIVSVSHFATYRSPSNFRLPDSFIPERWLGDPAFASDNHTAFQPFSVGPRNCLGRNLAYAEMRVILARVLWNFDMELSDDSLNWLDQKVYNLWDKGPLYTRLTPVIRGRHLKFPFQAVVLKPGGGLLLEFSGGLVCWKNA